MGKTQQKKRLLYIDILNILACLCVIFMHCNGIAHQYSDTAAWRQSMVCLLYTSFDEAMKRQQMYRTEEGRAMLRLQEGNTHHGGCGNCGGDN